MLTTTLPISAEQPSTGGLVRSCQFRCRSHILCLDWPPRWQVASSSLVVTTLIYFIFMVIKWYCIIVSHQLTQDRKTEGSNGGVACTKLLCRLHLRCCHRLSHGKAWHTITDINTILMIYHNCICFKIISLRPAIVTPCLPPPQMRDYVEISGWQPVFICLAMLFSIIAGLASIATRWDFLPQVSQMSPRRNGNKDDFLHHLLKLQ